MRWPGFALAERSGEPAVCPRRVGIGASPVHAARAEHDAYPGSRLSDRGLSPSGSLLRRRRRRQLRYRRRELALRARAGLLRTSAMLSDASNAFLYGDQAGGGTVTANPFGAGSNGQVATLGSEAIARAQIGSDASGPSSDRLAMMKSRANAQIFQRTCPGRRAVARSRRRQRTGATFEDRGRRTLRAAFRLPTRRSPIRTR